LRIREWDPITLSSTNARSNTRRLRGGLARP
jgi:hypothetical protein